MSDRTIRIISVVVYGTLGCVLLARAVDVTLHAPGWVSGAMYGVIGGFLAGFHASRPHWSYVGWRRGFDEGVKINKRREASR